MAGRGVSETNGWTCPHVRSYEAPCERCRAEVGTGICGRCNRPYDDHLGWNPRICFNGRIYA
jgi:hypothetical protein